MNRFEADVTVLDQAETFAQDEVRELNELQLALVGGGCGEVVFH